MSKYKIVSELVGEPGADFEPEEGTNIEALLNGGFIVQTDAKSGKINPETQPEE